MQTLADWPLAARRGLVGVFTDIDDTLTTEGAITADALQALHDLRAAGLVVIPITGRPIGWCTPFMEGGATQRWPVDTMVAENGAVAYVRAQVATPAQLQAKTASSPRGISVRRYQKYTNKMPPPEPANSAAMQQVAQRVLRKVPWRGPLARQCGARDRPRL